MVASEPSLKKSASRTRYDSVANVKKEEKQPEEPDDQIVDDYDF